MCWRQKRLRVLVSLSRSFSQAHPWARPPPSEMNAATRTGLQVQQKSYPRSDVRAPRGPGDRTLKGKSALVCFLCGSPAGAGSIGLMSRRKSVRML